jgi:undecaprenyl-diphosphatase
MLKNFISRIEAKLTVPVANRLGLSEISAALLRWFILAGLLTILFGILAEEVVSHESNTFDGVITGFIGQFTNPAVTLAMKVLTTLGSTGVISIIGTGLVITLVLLRRPLLDPLFIITATSGGLLISELLKSVFHRLRPDLNHLVHAAGYSFPSGHSMVSFAFYGAVAYLLLNCLPRTLIRRLIAGCIVLFVFFIGISRIYLGVHFPSDVAAGFIAGGAWLACCIMARQYVILKQHNNS